MDRRPTNPNNPRQSADYGIQRRPKQVHSGPPHHAAPLPKERRPQAQGPATNLEWNLKKLAGEYAGESLDAATYVTRTKADLALVVDALGAGAGGQEFASNAIAELNGIFGVGGGPGATTAASAPGASAPAGAAATGTPSTGTAMSTSDVKNLLTEKAKNAGEDLNWQTSVVDLLKLLGKDSSQTARHRYAVTLGFPENQISQMPSAEFNTWLHGQMLGLMASNGGNLPSNIA